MSIENSTSPMVKAWDPLIRVFHWSLVFFFLLAFITEDDWLSLHIQAGYAVSFLIAFRLLWGIIGSRNARFYSFVKSPQIVMSHLRAMLSLKPLHYLGHNPVAAVMVLLLLSSVAMVCFSGLILIASEGQGPLAGTMFSSLSGDWMEEVHEFLANFTVLLIVAHVCGVIVSSLLERENLAKAMITGRKKYRSNWADFKADKGGDHEVSI